MVVMRSVIVVKFVVTASSTTMVLAQLPSDVDQTIPLLIFFDILVLVLLPMLIDYTNMVLAQLSSDVNKTIPLLIIF
jgi:hypothetical protein